VASGISGFWGGSEHFLIINLVLLKKLGNIPYGCGKKGEEFFYYGRNYILVS